MPHQGDSSKHTLQGAISRSVNQLGLEKSGVSIGGINYRIIWKNKITRNPAY